MAGKRRTSNTPASRVAAAKKGRKSGAAALDEHDDFILDSDDERKMAKNAPEEEESDMETAEEKRLRLAKEYIGRIQAHVEAEGEDDRRGVTGGSDEEGDGDEEGDIAGKVAAHLKKDAAETLGRVQRKLASQVVLPGYAVSRGTAAAAAAAADLGEEEEGADTDAQPGTSVSGSAAGLARRGHRLPATALALTTDETTAFTVSKDGSVIRWDVETMARTRLYRPGEKGSGAADSAVAGDGGQGAAYWVSPKARSTSKMALVSAAVSSDGALLAVGGGDKRVHLFDARTGGFVQAFPGHRDAVTALAFRDGTHTLLSGSLDRTVKLWSCDDRAYMDTLFGHQGEVLGLDVLRAERAVSVGADRSCRVWKIPEETQLIYRYFGGPGSPPSVECCRYVTGTEWLTGASDGAVCLWTQLKRRPAHVVRGAHGAAAPGARIPSSVTPDVAGWIQSVAACRGSDMVASGAGDGAIRLWSVTSSKAGGAGSLQALGALPARGFVNGLAIGRSAKLVVAAMGQEPRMGRWGRDGGARNGLLVHRLESSGL